MRRRISSSMNTGSTHILHTRRWERFGRTINHLVYDLDQWTVDSVREAETAVAVDRRLKADQKEML